MNTEMEEEVTNFLVIEHNVGDGGYVTYIVDLWQGRLDDPATEINRYIAVYEGDTLEDEQGFAIDPDWAAADLTRFYRLEHSIKPEPLHFANLGVRKKGERDAISYRDQQENLLNPDAYTYGSDRRRKNLYIQFIEAIDILATDPDNEVAWAAVDAYRNYNAGLHEK